MKIDAISDCHGCKPALHGGDLLVVAGDLTANDTLLEHSDVLDWLYKQDYTHKVIIAGNHDKFLQKNPNFYCETNFHYLCDSYVELDGMLIYGSPWSLTFRGINPKCTAFTCREDDMRRHYAKIPWSTDILITHEPPFGILDYSTLEDGTFYHMGSHSLTFAINHISPYAHFFGHIHECGGMTEEKGHTIYANCSVMNENYDETGKIVSIEI